MEQRGESSRPHWWLTAAVGVACLAIGAGVMWLAVGRDSSLDAASVEPAVVVSTSAPTQSSTTLVDVPVVSHVSVEFPETLFGRVKLTPELNNMVGGKLADHVVQSLYPVWPAVQSFIPVSGEDYERKSETMGGLGALKVVWMPDPTGEGLVAPMTKEQMLAARTWLMNDLPMTAFEEQSSNGSSWTCSLGPSPIPAVYRPELGNDQPADTSSSMCSWTLPGVGALFIADFDVKTLADAMHNTALIVNMVVK